MICLNSLNIVYRLKVNCMENSIICRYIPLHVPKTKRLINAIF